MERAAGLLNDPKSSTSSRIIFFLDEKNFVVDPVFNPQNDRFIRLNNFDDDKDTGRYMPRSKHPASAMFLGAVASTGEVLPPIWFPEGFRLDADAYIDALKKTLIPWMRSVAASHRATFVFQQDSAPAHRAKKTLNFLKKEKNPF